MTDSLPPGTSAPRPSRSSQFADLVRATVVTHQPTWTPERFELVRALEDFQLWFATDGFFARPLKRIFDAWRACGIEPPKEIVDHPRAAMGTSVLEIVASQRPQWDDQLLDMWLDLNRQLATGQRLEVLAEAVAPLDNAIGLLDEFWRGLVKWTGYEIVNGRIVAEEAYPPFDRASIDAAVQAELRARMRANELLAEATRRWTTQLRDESIRAISSPMPKLRSLFDSTVAMSTGGPVSRTALLGALGGDPSRLRRSVNKRNSGRPWDPDLLDVHDQDGRIHYTRESVLRHLAHKFSIATDDELLRAGVLPVKCPWLTRGTRPPS